MGEKDGEEKGEGGREGWIGLLALGAHRWMMMMMRELVSAVFGGDVLRG